MLGIGRKILFPYNNQSVFSRIASGTFWSLVGVAAGKAIVLIASIFCARILGEFYFGQLGIVRSTIAMFIVLGSAGLGTTASKYIAEYRATSNVEGITKIYYLTNGFALLLALLIAGLVLLNAEAIAVSNFNDKTITRAIQIGSILLLFSIINAAQNGVISGFEKFKTIALNTFWASFVEGIAIVIGAYLNGAEGAIWGYGLSFIFWTLLNYLSIKKIFCTEGISKKYRSLTRNDYSIIWKFSIPAALNSIMVTPTFWAIKTMLVRYNDFGSLGVYEAADQWKIIILFIPNAIANILVPILSNVNGKNDKASYTKVLKFSLVLNGGIALLLSAFVYVFQDFIMGLYGSGFVESGVLFVLILSTVFSSMAQVLTLSLVSKTKAWISFAFNFVWSIVMIATTYFFLENGCGVISLAYANLIAYIMHFFFQLLYFVVKWNK